MGAEGETLTHDDVWDDSMLVDSWNQALEEYKVSERWRKRRLVHRG
jgi:hypothetical protein